MGKNKKYVILSGLDFEDNNRGSAALGYGAIAFLEENEMVSDMTVFVSFSHSHRFFGRCPIIKREILSNGKKWTHISVSTSRIERKLFLLLGILLPFTQFRNIIRNCAFVAGLYGGDGFSDIYGDYIFLNRLPDTRFAMKANIPLYIMPQTLGPFSTIKCREIADKILRYATKIYVRDDTFVQELKKMDLAFERTKDLSYYMKPQDVDIEIKSMSVGINISGLAYSNKFATLAGQFDCYPILVSKLIERFQSIGVTVYLIPHSYNYYQPEENNDDLQACKEVFKLLESKDNVILVNMNLSAPQLKYIISRMSYFIGTRMHANFAAIYSGIPLFGLAYSQKFEGAFIANNVYNDNVSYINNINLHDCDEIINKVINDYLRRI